MLIRYIVGVIIRIILIVLIYDWKVSRMTSVEYDELKKRISELRPELRGISSHDEVVQVRLVNNILSVIEDFYKKHKSSD